MNSEHFTTPESLQLLGIQLCKDCGSHMSIDNSTCYNCGFINDDLFLNEASLNGKYCKPNDFNEKEMYLVMVEPETPSRHIKSYHIMKSNYTLCGLSVSKRNKFDLVGRMTLARIPAFYKNPCKRCLTQLEKQN